MKTITAHIKEKGGAILHPTYTISDEEYRFVDRQFFIDFWGLDNDDVDCYVLEGI